MLAFVHDTNTDRLLFASEVRALQRSRLIPDEPNLEALVRYLQLGSVPVPLTTVQNLLALPAGHYLSASAQGVKLHEYWNFAYIPQQTEHANGPSSRQDTQHHIQRLLEQSVQSHLISDVPLGVFLSGGIDSSALVALTSRGQSHGLKTVSVVFDEPEYDESTYARSVAQQYHTDHHEIRLRREQWFAELPKVFAAMDQPTGDGINTYFVSQAAKQAGLTVVLSGIGGDEVFCGYKHLKESVKFEQQRNVLARLPQSLRTGMLRVSAQAGTLVGKIGVEKLAYLEEPTCDNTYLLFRGLFPPQQIPELLGISAAELSAYGPMVRSLNNRSARAWNDAAPWYEFTYYLQSQLLADSTVYDDGGFDHRVQQSCQAPSSEFGAICIVGVCRHVAVAVLLDGDE